MIVDADVIRNERTSDAPVRVALSGALPAVETRGLRKVYRGSVAVADLTLEIRQGEVFGLLGPNGAGKTTSVKMLMGLVRPTAGSARLLGRPLGDREAKRRIGFLPELFRFHDWLTGAELLEFHGKLYGMSAAERRRRIPEVLELVGLAHRAGEPVRSYSKGMQQRAGLAQALLNDPDLVFLDEPTSALDPLGRLEVRNIIRTLREAGKTVVLNSHLLSEVEMVCDRVAIINRGQVAAVGPIRELVGEDLAVELVIDGCRDDAEALLARYGTVREIVADGPERQKVRLEVQDDDAIAAVIGELVRAGIRVYSATPIQATLEELFFDIVGGETMERPR
jgi:ABC-2 type transport system ATP-binding protein